MGGGAGAGAGGGGMSHVTSKSNNAYPCRSLRKQEGARASPNQLDQLNHIHHIHHSPS